MSARKLNAKQRRFVDEYLVDLNATQAAIRAGYSEKTAGAIGHELLKKPEIGEAIATAMKARSSRTEVTADRVLVEVARLAFFDIRRLLNADGTAKPITELDDDTAAALAGLDVFEEFAGSGEERAQIGFTKKFRIADKKGSLELLMKHLGMIKPTDLNLKFPDGVPKVLVEVVKSGPK